MWQRLIIDITEIINKDAFVNLIIKDNINRIKEEEKKLYTKIIYGVVENKKWLDYLLRPYVKNGRFKPNVKNTLRIGAYALSYLNLAKFYVVDSLVNAIKKQDYKASKAINVILRTFIKDCRFDKAKVEIEQLKLEEKESIIYNVEPEILRLIKRDYPSQYHEILQNEEDTYNSYRINFLKTNTQEIIDNLKENLIEYEVLEEAIITKKSLINTKIFKNALIIPQDLSSMEVARVMNPPVNAKVLDACSAPGSKAFHMATIMKNTGCILACDIYEHKLKLIQDEAVRQGITNIKTALYDATNSNYNQTFKYILVDAPCSGMGTMKHKGDLKFRLTLDKIDNIKNIQRQILENVIKYLEYDGILVYSTCTINKDENERQIEQLISNHSDIKKINEKTYLPSSKQDGFYICKLQRKRD